MQSLSRCSAIPPTAAAAYEKEKLQERGRELFRAFQDALGVDPDQVPEPTAQKQARALATLPERFDAYDVFGFVRWKSSNPYFADAGTIKTGHVLGSG